MGLRFLFCFPRSEIPGSETSYILQRTAEDGAISETERNIVKPNERVAIDKFSLFLNRPSWLYLSKLFYLSTQAARVLRQNHLPQTAHVLWQSMYTDVPCTWAVHVHKRSMYLGSLCTQTSHVLWQSMYTSGPCLQADHVPRWPMYLSSPCTQAVHVHKRSMYLGSPCTQAAHVLRHSMYPGGPRTQAVHVPRWPKYTWQVHVPQWPKCSGSPCTQAVHVPTQAASSPFKPLKPVPETTYIMHTIYSN